MEKTMGHESDDKINCNWCSWYSDQRIGTRTGGVVNDRRVGVETFQTNLGQMTRSYNNQQKEENLQNCGLCYSSWLQNKSESKCKDGYVPRPC